MRTYKYYIESFGCQMNAYDTEVISSRLASNGNDRVGSPADADVLIVNTCSVREHAEARAIGRLHDLSRHDGAVLVVCGCMAKRLGEELAERVPGIDIVAGPDHYDELPGIIGRALEGGRGACLVSENPSITYRLEETAREGGAGRYVSITRGCENFCTYCIVPYLRGKVRSREPGEILSEIRMLVDGGAREITLLGQNVMAYRHGATGFVDLARSILGETSVARLRFLTTHPRDLDMAVFGIMAESRALCPHIHLPAQSGSNRILTLMGRGYSRERYLDLVDGARSIVPDLAVTTDLIVGFPTETEEDFQLTLDLVDRGRFDAAFTFKYSPRRGTAAASMRDDVSLETKKERLARLNEKITSIRKGILREHVGKREEIMLDAAVEKGEYHFMKGRTRHFRNVLVEDARLEPGYILEVDLVRLRNYTYIGKVPARR